MSEQNRQIQNLLCSHRNDIINEWKTQNATNSCLFQTFTNTQTLYEAIFDTVVSALVNGTVQTQCPMLQEVEKTLETASEITSADIFTFCVPLKDITIYLIATHLKTANIRTVQDIFNASFQSVLKLLDEQKTKLYQSKTF